MADWSLPLLTSTYANFRTYLLDRDIDAMTLLKTPGSASNLPTGAIRYNRSTNLFEEWDGAAWGVKTLAVAGGGTGATTAAGARSNLGLGTIAVQDASNVAITGGAISGLTALGLSGHVTLSANVSYDIGTYANKVRNFFVGTGCVLPVGADKYVTI